MSVIGIVCEFNPFHNGHKYLIDKVKGKNDIIVTLMSGNYVQRGEPALFPKEVRVKSALSGGADIVIELPFLYATASAEYFAYAAVEILSAVNCDKIAFGTESDNLKDLQDAADVLLSADFNSEIKKQLERGVSYPAARQAVFDRYNLKCDISSPNNILAIEYLKAIKKSGSAVKPVAVKRIGAGYNDKKPIDGFASATYIRELIQNNRDYVGFVPDEACAFYDEAIKSGNFVCRQRYETALLSILRSKLNCDLSEIANMSEGLENRIKSAINSGTSLENVYALAKTKRYTHSRIRRAVLSVCFDIKEKDLKIPVPYCRVLGFNENSSDSLGRIAKKSSIPFVSTYKDTANLSFGFASKVFEYENCSSNIYNALLQNSRACSTEKTYSPVKMK